MLPHLCILCFITFLAIYQGKFVFGKFQQKLGLRSDPPSPSWAKCPTFSENGFWGPPLVSFDKRNPDWKSCQIKKWIYFDHRQHWQKEALPSKIHQKCFLCLFTRRCYEIDGMTNERCKYLVWWCSSSSNDKITTIDKNKNVLELWYSLTCCMSFKF